MFLRLSMKIETTELHLFSSHDLSVVDQCMAFAPSRCYPMLNRKHVSHSATVGAM